MPASTIQRLVEGVLCSLKTVNSSSLTTGSWSIPFLFTGCQPVTKPLSFVFSLFSILLVIHLFRLSQLPHDNIVGVGVTSILLKLNIFRNVTVIWKFQKKNYLELSIYIFGTVMQHLSAKRQQWEYGHNCFCSSLNRMWRRDFKAKSQPHHYLNKLHIYSLSLDPPAVSWWLASWW